MCRVIAGKMWLWGNIYVIANNYFVGKHLYIVAFLLLLHQEKNLESVLILTLICFSVCFSVYLRFFSASLTSLLLRIDHYSLQSENPNLLENIP